MRQKLFPVLLSLVVALPLASSAQASPRDDAPWTFGAIRRAIVKVMKHLPFIPNDGIDVPKP